MCTYIYIYMSPIPFGLMRLGSLSSIINTQANFCYTILIFAYNDRNETTHQTHGIYYILYAIYRIVHTIHYISYIIYIHLGGFSKLGVPFGGPDNKDYSILRPILVSPSFEKLPSGSSSEATIL